MDPRTNPGKPEVMSPAGGWPELVAAVEAGADAVYFGLRHFTARAKVGFGLDDLPGVMRHLHGRGVRGYVAFNTLVFDAELDHAAGALARIAEAGADAVIVQDLGAVRLAREVAPELPVHGSTQMTLTSAEGIALVRELGVTRVILARELSLDDIRDIRAATDAELEMFVHGALCVSYSGQCFSSEAWGGRSANRGQCAQACRLPYDLIVDGAERPLGDARYLLSPGDLSTLAEIPAIVAAGLDALKIEGRYKDAAYVGLVTQAYRRAVDAAAAGRSPETTPEEALRVEQVYSRGSGPWFVQGVDHQAVVRGRAPRHRGVLLGRVATVFADGVTVTPEPAHALAPLKPGDGVVFDAADRRSPEEREEGGRLYEVREARGGHLELRFGNGVLDPARIAPGDLLWRTSDPDVARAARVFDGSRPPARRIPVRVEARAAAGEPLETTWSVAGPTPARVTVRSPGPLDEAARRPLDESTLREQLGRLGGTAFELADVTLATDGRAFAPMSMLNELRRQAAAELAEALQAPPARTVGDPSGALAAVRAGAAGAPRTGPRQTALHLLVRTPEQLDAAIALAPASVTLDYLDLYGLKPSVERVRAAGLEARVASPRVLKPREERVVTFLRKLECGVLVRSLGLAHTLRADAGVPLTGDFSLNAANPVTAALLLELGFLRIAPTHDLDGAQVTELAHAVGGPRLEVIAYHHLPVFHTEHCVFCRFLSSGTSYRDCGRPCDTHRLALRDPLGREHPVHADVGCRNTVFGTEAQEGSAHLDAWRDAGVVDFRLEFVQETGDQVTRVTEAFRRALAPGASAAALRRELARVAPGGTTEGSLHVPRHPVPIPVLG